MDNNTLEEFCTSLKQVTDVVRELGTLEDEKANAAAKGRHSTMDAFLKKEQVLILKLKGTERTRLRLTDELGWTGLTFRQILDQAQEPEKTVLQPYFDELNLQTKRLLDARDNAKRMITFRVAEFERLLAGQEISYDEKGRAVSAAPRSFRDRYV